MHRYHSNRGKIYHIYHIYKLKEGSSRLDRDVTGIKRPLIFSEALKSCCIMPEHGRCEDNNVGVDKSIATDLIRLRKHPRQKHGTSVVVFSELVAMDFR